MKIHSHIDLITNSSTEIFTDYSDCIKYIYKTLDAIIKLQGIKLKSSDIVSIINSVECIDWLAEDLTIEIEKNKHTWLDKNFNIKRFMSTEDFSVKEKMLEKYINDILEGKYPEPNWLKDYVTDEDRFRRMKLYYKIKDKKYKKYKKIIENIIDAIKSSNSRPLYC